MKNPWFPVVLATALAGSPAQTVLPIADLLLHEVTRDGYIEIIRCEGNTLLGDRRFAGESVLGGLRPGEGAPFRDVGGSGHFTRDQLLEVLRVLGFVPEVCIRGDSLVVPTGKADSYRRILDELRQALPPRLDVTVRLTHTVGDKTVTRLLRNASLEPGRLHVLSNLDRRAAVLDYQVEIAQAAMIANPVVGEVRGGTMVAIRPQLTPSGEWAVLETIARCVDDGPDANIETGHPGLGPIDRAPLRISETGRVVRVRPGSRSVQRWSGEHGTFELTLVTQWQLPKPVRPGGQDIGFFSMRGTLPGYRSVPVYPERNDEGFDDEPEEPWGDIADFAGGDAMWLEGPDLDEAPDAQRFVAANTSKFAIGAAVMGWFESLTAGPELEVRCFDVAADTEWPDDGTTPTGARLVGQTRLSQVDGTWSATAVRSEKSVVRDWDAEVAQSSRIPDPKVRRVSTGLVINLRRLGDRVEIEGEISRILDPGHKTLALSQPIFSPGASTTNNTGQNDSPAVGLLADSVRVEHPRIAVAPLHFARQLGEQQPAFYRASATALFGDGRELVLVVSHAK